MSAGSLAALEFAAAGHERRASLRANTALFRTLMAREGFPIVPGEHPIVPVMFGDASAAVRTADEMLRQGVYVVAFSHPVVPAGQARIRVQISAAHSAGDIEECVDAFVAATRFRRSVGARDDQAM